MWNKMAFNVHSFCKNKLKIKIKFHCFIYFLIWSGSFATPVSMCFIVVKDISLSACEVNAEE
jgi:hypothetical protein